MPATDDLRVLVMEPEENLRHYLGRLLNTTEGFRCVGFCDNPDDLESAAHRHAPQVLLLDLHTATTMPTGRLPRLRSSLPELMVVLTDLEEGPRYKRLARHAGADTFMSTVRAPEDLEEVRRKYLALAAQNQHRRKSAGGQAAGAL